ncbi:MAG: Rho termination factor N-terminal domain-containing protein [Solirubrobacteraceae bacterium]
MSVLDREALEASPLADLHTIASELGIDGYRRLRKADLVDRILGVTGGETAAPADADADEPARPRRRRGGRGRAARDADDGDSDSPAADGSQDDEDDDEAPARPARRRRARAEEAPVADSDADDDEDEAPARPARRRRARAEEAPAEDDGDAEDRPRARRRGRRDAEPEGEPVAVEGVLDLLPNGSGFVRVAHPETSDADAYVSAAQVRRCELVAGDRVGGPVRPARRSEKHPSLIRIDTINGAPADEVAGEGTRYDELPAAYPEARLALGSEDPTLKAIEWLTPFGKGSRVTITGAARAGKTEALRRIAAALAGREGLEIWVVLAGARPEEVGEWQQGPAEVAGAAPLGASPDAQAAAVEAAVERARRIAARGGDAVVIVDSLDALPPHAARRALAAARNLREAGSVTVIAAAAAPLGGESTVVALDPALTAAGRFPAIDLSASGTIRPDLLVGAAGAEAIAGARAELL